MLVFPSYNQYEIVMHLQYYLNTVHITEHTPYSFLRMHIEEQ